jgi:hypothetical protein
MPLIGEGGLRDMAQFGKELKEFLKAQGFSATHCVIGLDASYLASRQKRLPQAAAANFADILRIAAEQDFASEGQDLMTDYVPEPGGGGTGALLVAAPRAVADALVAAVSEAGLSVRAVSSSALALAGATAGAPESGVRLVLCLGTDSAELAVQVDGGPRLLRRLAIRTAPGPDAETQKRYLSEVEADLRRGLALSAAQSHANPAELLVWNAVGMESSALREMGERLGVPLRVASLATDLPQLDSAAWPSPSAELGASCRNPAPAAALALSHAAGRLPLDFLHSRLAVKKQGRFGRVAIWSTVAAAIVLGGIVWLFVDWHNNQREIELLDSSLNSRATALLDANRLITKTRFAQGWYDRRPKFMECLRELAVAFPDNNIWASSLNVREDMHVTLSGKAADDQWVIRLQNSLKADPRLSEVRLISITGRPNTREVSFAINFTFVGAG